MAVRIANATALTVTASTAFTLPGRWSSVPVKSNVTSSPATVRVQRDACRRLLLRPGTGRVEHVGRTATARPAARREQRACAALHSRAPRRSARCPRARATSSANRETPSTLAPHCASRSPRRSSGVRDASTTRASTASSIRVGGRRSPSSSMVSASGGIEPGALPPTSAWCARLATHPTSGPSPVTPANTGDDHREVVEVGATRERVVEQRRRTGPGGRSLPSPTPASIRGAPGCAPPARAVRRRP